MNATLLLPFHILARLVNQRLKLLIGACKVDKVVYRCRHILQGSDLQCRSAVEFNQPIAVLQGVVDGACLIEPTRANGFLPAPLFDGVLCLPIDADGFVCLLLCLLGRDEHINRRFCLAVGVGLLDGYEFEGWLGHRKVPFGLVSAFDEKNIALFWFWFKLEKCELGNLFFLTIL